MIRLERSESNSCIQYILKMCIKIDVHNQLELILTNTVKKKLIQLDQIARNKSTVIAVQL